MFLLIGYGAVIVSRGNTGYPFKPGGYSSWIEVYSWSFMEGGGGLIGSEFWVVDGEGDGGYCGEVVFIELVIERRV